MYINIKTVQITNVKIKDWAACPLVGRLVGWIEIAANNIDKNGYLAVTNEWNDFITTKTIINNNLDICYVRD